MTSKNIGLILQTPEVVSESRMERRMQDPSDQAPLGSGSVQPFTGIEPDVKPNVSKPDRKTDDASHVSVKTQEVNEISKSFNELVLDKGESWWRMDDRGSLFLDERPNAMKQSVHRRPEFGRASVTGSLPYRIVCHCDGGAEQSPQGNKDRSGDTSKEN